MRCRSPSSPPEGFAPTAALRTAAALAAAASAIPTAPVHAQDLAFRELQQSTHFDCATVHDSARDRFVALSAGRTLEWDGLAWRTRATATPAPARYQGQMWFDRARGRAVAFGGTSYGFVPGGGGTPLANDLWEYDGTDWRQRTVPIGPSGRYQHAVAYDRDRGVAVLYGGIDAASFLLNDTWEWNGATWSRRVAAAPPVFTGMAMCYHPRMRRTLLFGGADTQRLLDQTWSWNGTTWTQLLPNTTPPARAGHALTYEPQRNRIVMFGGYDTQSWEWDGSDWSPGRTGPEPRALYGFATDDDSRTILFGGMLTRPGAALGAAVGLGDTWLHERGRWREVTRTGPPLHTASQCDYDAGRDRLVFGGGVDSNSRHTWEWDGAQWHERAVAFEPPLLIAARLCYDRTRSVCVQFGGFQVAGLLGAVNATFLWDGAAWTQANPATSPPPRYRHAMVHDRARGTMLVVGGTAPGTILGDTWEWNGATWTQRASTGPPARHGAGMAYDIARARTVLFGGIGAGGNFLGDTWEWDGFTWQLRSPPTSPLPRTDPVMAYDTARARTLLVGGAGNTPAGPNTGFRELWEWDGTTWTGGSRDLPDVRNGWSALVEHDRLGSLVLLQAVSSAGVTFSTDLWLVSPRVAGAITDSGGCGGALVPRLDPFGPPALGNRQFALDVERTPAGSPVLLGVAATSGNIALGAGCVLHLPSLDLAFAAMARASGTATLRLPIPADTALLGLTPALQAAALDATAPLGIALTGLVRLRLGE